MVLQNGKWCGVSAIKSLQLTTELQAGKHVQHVMWVSTWMAATKCCCHQSSNKMLSKHELSESHPRAPPRIANHDITIRGEEIKGCWCNVWQRSSSCFYLASIFSVFNFKGSCSSSSVRSLRLHLPIFNNWCNLTANICPIFKLIESCFLCLGLFIEYDSVNEDSNQVTNERQSIK